MNHMYVYRYLCVSLRHFEQDLLKTPRALKLKMGPRERARLKRLQI